jgi:hypothetical protein
LKPPIAKSRQKLSLILSSNGGNSESYGAAALDNECDRVARAPVGGRNHQLNASAFSLGQLVAGGVLDESEVRHRLTDAAASLAKDDGDNSVKHTINSGLTGGMAKPRTPPATGSPPKKRTTEPRPAVPPLAIKTSAEFITGYVAPDYILDGMLQQAFLYSLTGATGAGKTSITLRLAASTALGEQFANRETKKGRVLYLAAENPDDARMRWIALAQQMEFDVNTIEVFFVDRRFTISKMKELLTAELHRHGGEFVLVIIDTGPAFFEGDDESSRAQMSVHATMFRGLIDIIPGRPCIIVNCHPVKNAAPDNLLPSGGGTFLNEMDGNLTASKTESTVELHWQGKFRGPEFAPLHFLIKTVTHQDLKDKKGRLIPTCMCEFISDQVKEEIAKAKVVDENGVLELISQNPKISLASIATAMNWKLYSGDPNKMKAKRCVEALKKAKFVKETRGGLLEITAEGKKALKGEEGMEGQNE